MEVKMMTELIKEAKSKIKKINNTIYLAEKLKINCIDIEISLCCEGLLFTLFKMEDLKHVCKMLYIAIGEKFTYKLQCITKKFNGVCISYVYDGNCDILNDIIIWVYLNSEEEIPKSLYDKKTCYFEKQANESYYLRCEVKK